MIYLKICGKTVLTSSSNALSNETSNAALEGYTFKTVQNLAILKNGKDIVASSKNILQDDMHLGGKEMREDEKERNGYGDKKKDLKKEKKRLYLSEQDVFIRQRWLVDRLII
ncbi:hypothetical protein TWF694_006282 [Orbilia ellipsospora]|uniref:Uncharacterized protein n=1 Tax=Orbilia ellipsospora TaxID=2528407 RepID=A0AAV9XK21_9PEZI